MKHRKNRIIRKEDDSLRMVPTGIQKYFLSSVLKALALEVVTVGLLSQPSYNPRSSRDDATHWSWSVCALLISECVAHLQCSFERHCCQLCMFSPTITCQNMAGVRHGSSFYIDMDWMRTPSKDEDLVSVVKGSGCSSLHGSFFFHWFLFSPEENKNMNMVVILDTGRQQAAELV